MADNWQLKAVLSAVDKMSPVLKGVGNTARATRKYLADVAGAAGNLAGHVGLPTALAGGVFAGFSLAKIKDAMLGLTAMEDEVSKFSATTGIAGAEFKRWQYLATLSNVPFDALTGSMAKANKQIHEAATGKNKDLAGLYKRLGVSLRDSNGDLRSMADMLPELADAFARNENPVVRARMGMALFGKSWQDIMPLLADGSAKINERMARFRELGLEVKDTKAFDSQLQAIGAFGDRLDDLSFVAKGFQNTIAAGLIPVVSPLIEDLTRWIVLNKELVAGEVKVFVADLAGGLRAIDWKGVADGARSFGNGLREVVDFVGGAKNALIGLVIVMNLQTIAAFVGLLGSVGRLGLGLAGLAGSALAPIAPLKLLQAEMAAANMRGVAMVGTLGKLSAAAGIAGAAFAGWEIGKWLNDSVINPGIQKLTGDKDASLGTWIYDKLHPEEAAPARPSLIGAGQVKASGEIKVSFEGAPAGMRVEQTKASGDVPINTNVGYRSFALGMP